MAARCGLGLPTVIRVPPVLDDGTPFPTLFWLTCPELRRRVSGLESEGGVRAFQARRRSDPMLAQACDEADAAYAEERDALVPPGHEGPRPTGGVGGTHGGVKCLHAHVAHFLAGRPNPIGAEVAAAIGVPRCQTDCIGRRLPDAIQAAGEP